MLLYVFCKYNLNLNPVQANRGRRRISRDHYRRLGADVGLASRTVLLFLKIFSFYHKECHQQQQQLNLIL